MMKTFDFDHSEPQPNLLKCAISKQFNLCLRHSGHGRGHNYDNMT